MSATKTQRTSGSVSDSGNVTQLLRQYANGDQSAMNELVPLVYEDLKAIARNQLRKSSVRQAMKTTALVHEAYEKLTIGAEQDFKDRQHYMAICARAMRQIVVDEYRRRASQKRGGDAVHAEIQTGHLVEGAQPRDMVALDEALNRLEKQDADLVKLLELSAFAGLETQEIADITGQSLRTVQRNLAKARAWITAGLAAD